MFRSIRNLLALGGKKPVHKPSKFFKKTNVKFEMLEDRTSPAVDITSDFGGAVATRQMPENTTLVTTVVAQATAPDSPPIVYSLSTLGGQPQQAAFFNINPNTGVLSFNSAPDFENPQGSGSPPSNDYFVQVRATATNTGTFDEQLIAVSVTNANDPPIVGADSLSAVNEDSGPRTIPFATLLANDLPGPANANEGNQTIQIIGVSNPSGGTVTLNSQNSTITFTPSANFNGTASFVYTIQDNGQTNGVNDFKTGSGTASFPVNPVADAPVSLSGSLTAIANQSTSGSMVAFDADGDNLTYTFVDTANANGTVALANPPVPGNPGAFVYTPNPNYTGPASFTFRVTDSSPSALQSNISTISINVVPSGNPNNNPPVAQDGSLSTQEDTPATGTLVATDVDPGTTLTYTIIPTGNTNGTATLLNANTGSYVYSPNTNFSGTASFLFIASDGTANSNAATITILVSAVNDAPVVSTNTLTISEGGTVNLTAANISATDPDLPPPQITYTASSIARGRFELVSAPGTAITTFTQAQIDAGAVRFVHDGSELAPTYTLVANDGNVNSVASTVQVNFTNVNDKPVAVAGTANTLRNTPVSGQLVGTDVDLNASLTYALEGSPVNGTVTINPTSGAYSFTPGPNFSGEASFQFTVNDNNTLVAPFNLTSDPATITINVAEVNEPPVAQSSTFTVAEDSTTTLKMVATDANNPQNLVYILVSPVTNGTISLTNPADGTFIYKPSPDFNGQASFQFKVNDGFVDSNIATVTLVVTPVNDPPIANPVNATTPEDTLLVGILTSSDIDGGTPSYFLVGTPANGVATVNQSTGVYTFLPNQNFNGQASFQFNVTDGNGGTSNTATVAITVTPVNDNPVIGNNAPLLALQVPENTTAVTKAVVTDIDSPLSAMTFSLAQLGNDNLQNGFFDIVASGPNAGTLTFKVAPDFENPQGSISNGVPTNTYFANVRVADGAGGFDEQLYSITVTNANDPPIGVNDTLPSVAEGSAEFSVPFATLLANDLTGAGNSNDGTQTLTIIPNAVGVPGPTGGTVVVDTVNQVVRFTPNSTFNGTGSFTYTLQDNGSPPRKATAVASFTVTPVDDDAPTIGNATRSVAANSPVGTNVGNPVTGSDPDGNAGLTYSITGSAFAINSTTGQITVADQSQIQIPGTQFTVLVTVKDPTNRSATATVTINLGALQVTNQTPTANNDTLPDVFEDNSQTSASGNFSFTIPASLLLANDFTGNNVNEPGQTLSVVIQGGGGNRNGLSDDATVSGGIVTIPVAANFNGNAFFRYQARDNGQTNGENNFRNSSTVQVNFRVISVNDQPTISDQTFTIAGNVPNSTANSPNGTVVSGANGQTANVSASDRDGTSGLTYGPLVPTGATPAGAFSLNPTNGQLTVADQNLVTAANGPFTYTVTVTDNGVPQLTSTPANITINVVGANNNSPTFTNSTVGGNSSTINISEGNGNTNNVDALPVTTVEASGGDPNETVTFSIAGGDDASKFRIDSSGRLFFRDGNDTKNFPTFASRGDADGDNAYKVTIRATDNGAPQRFTDRAITVNVRATVDQSIVYFNPSFSGDAGTVILDADPVTPGNQPATVGQNAHNKLTSDNLNKVADGGGLLMFVPNSGQTTLSIGGDDSNIPTTTTPVRFSVPAGVRATITSRLRGSQALNKVGAGTLILTATNNDFSGGVNINEGRLSVSLNSPLGAASNIVTVNSPGVFESTGTWASSRTFFLNNGATMNVANGVFTLNGATINGGFISGPGELRTGSSTPTVFTGSRSTSSLLLSVNENATFNSFENGGRLDIAAGKTATLNQFTNTSSGRLNVNGTALVNDFTSNGQMTVASTGTVTNTGGSGLTFGGGSVTTINAAGSVRGIIDLGTSPAILSGGLMINNGVVGSVTPNADLIVDFGGFAKGTGTYVSVLTRNGGVFSPGSSPGTASTSDFKLNAGGTFQFEISNATGTAGDLSGWDLLILEPNEFSPSAKTTYSATPAAPYNVNIVSLLDSGDRNSAGPAANFNPNQGYSWKFINGSNNDVSVVGNFDPAAFNIVTNGFANSFSGTFSIASTDEGKSLSVVYTPTAAAATTTTLTASPLATTGGSLVVLTATVAPSPDMSGTVTFLDNGVAIPGGANVAVTGGVATFSTSTLSVGSHPITAAYSGAAGFAASTSNTQTVVVGEAAVQPQVLSVTPNAGQSAFVGAQRSRVVNMTVVFDQAVQLDENAISLALHTKDVSYGGALQPNGFGSLPTTLNFDSTDNKTWTITFSGNTEVGADGFQSLKDGVYDLIIDGSKVHPQGSPTVNLGATSTTTFHRLFGDTGAPATPAGGVQGVDFQAIVNTGDNLVFRNAFNNEANYKAYLDFNGDGTINSGDNLQFRTRFNKTLNWKV